MPVETLEKICGILGCKIDDIIDFEAEPAALALKTKKTAGTHQTAGKEKQLP